MNALGRALLTMAIATAIAFGLLWMFSAQLDQCPDGWVYVLSTDKWVCVKQGG